MIKFLENPLFEFCILMGVAAAIGYQVNNHETRLKALEPRVTSMDTQLFDLELTESEDDTSQATKIRELFSDDSAVDEKIRALKASVEALEHDIAAIEKRSVIVLSPQPAASPASYTYPGSFIQTTPCSVLCTQ